MTAKIMLCLFIINLGTAFGAGIYEMRIVLPMWFRKTSNGYTVNAPVMEGMDVGRNFWVMVTTLPLTLLTIANFYFAFKASGPLHTWWLTVTIIALAERVLTFSFFIPTALKFVKPGAIPEDQLSNTVTSWRNTNYLRILISFLTFTMALRTLLLV